MQWVLLFGCGIVFAVFGLFLMNKVDRFLENQKNPQKGVLDTEKERLRIAFENPMMIGSVEKVTELFSKKHHSCAFYFYTGSDQEIFQGLKTGKIDIGFLTAESDMTAYPEYSILIVPLKPCTVLSRTIDVPVTPLEPQTSSTSAKVVWWNAKSPKVRSDFLRYLTCYKA
ncbi:MAG: hypothetical protein ACOX7K_05815 [Oscillospiraceae bacterium]|jgi:hypothetical protein